MKSTIANVRRTGTRNAVPLALLCCLASQPAYTAPPDEVEQEQTEASPVELFRLFALAACIAKAAPPIRDQANAAAGGALQNGDGPFEAYEQVAAAARDFVKRDYGNLGSADLGLMKCVDFMKSQALATIIRRHYPAAARGPTRKHGPE